MHFPSFLSIPSMTWAGRCRWPGLEMAQGWVLYYMSLSCCVVPLWHEEDKHGWIVQWTVWKWQGSLPGKNLVGYIMSSLTSGSHTRTLINDPCSTFLRLNLRFLAGYPGFDDFSGALLHAQTRAVQTLSKVRVMISPGGKKNTWFVFDLHLIWLQPFFH